jgi:hypothetical protein
MRMLGYAHFMGLANYASCGIADFMRPYYNSTVTNPLSCVLPNMRLVWGGNVFGQCLMLCLLHVMSIEIPGRSRE